MLLKCVKIRLHRETEVHCYNNSFHCRSRSDSFRSRNDGFQCSKDIYFFSTVQIWLNLKQLNFHRLKSTTIITINNPKETLILCRTFFPRGWFSPVWYEMFSLRQWSRFVWNTSLVDTSILNIHNRSKWDMCSYRSVQSVWLNRMQPRMRAARLNQAGSEDEIENLLVWLWIMWKWSKKPVPRYHTKLMTVLRGELDRVTGWR